jgi:hypothetical protein
MFSHALFEQRNSRNENMRDIMYSNNNVIIIALHDIMVFLQKFLLFRITIVPSCSVAACFRSVTDRIGTFSVHFE